MQIKRPEPNLLDRLVNYVSPQAGARRLQARAVQNAFDLLSGNAGGETALGGAYASTSSNSNSRGYRPAPRSAVADQSGELRTLRGQSRDLARNNGIALGAINTNVHRVVGTGLALSVNPDAEVLGWTEEEVQNWKSLVQREFALWADNPAACDITGQQTFYQLQELVLRTVLESGDGFSNLPDAPKATRMQPYRLRVQVLEADRVGNPGNKADTDREAGGVRMDANGAVEAYHLYRSHPGGLHLGRDRWAGDWVTAVGRSGRRRMLHHFRRLRPEEPRGVPYLTPVIDYLRQLTEYSNHEIRAAVVSSMFTVFVSKDGSQSGSQGPVFTGAGDEATAAGFQADDVSMGSAAIVDLEPGENVSFADPTRPNTAFEPFVLAFCRFIGVALGLPYEVLVKQFNSSYTASRAALLDAWIYLRTVRAWLVTSFCQPVYETWLAEAVAIGRVPAPGFFEDPLLRWAYCQAAWNGDSQGSINPKDEVAAYRDAIDGALLTHERAEWELFGTDWYGTLPRKAAERKAMDRAGVTPAPRAGSAAPAAQQQAPGQPQQQRQPGGNDPTKRNGE